MTDAYSGSVDYYISDPDDPLIQSYRKIFPDLFKDLADMPSYLQDHVRYPRDLFTIQTRVLLQYHMTNPETFFQKGDQWSIPVQSSFGREGTLDPYYILARLPGEGERGVPTYPAIYSRPKGPTEGMDSRSERRTALRRNGPV